MELNGGGKRNPPVVFKTIFVRTARIPRRVILVYVRLAAVAACAFAGAAPAFAIVPAGYPGSAYMGKIQEIPGRVFLSDFDQGPKNVVWHDFETRNQWACKVRDSTGVGLQLMGQGGDKGDTKEADTLVQARKGKCYLAQTNTGDWTKYTVKVNQKGTYSLAMLTAAQGTTTPFVAASLLSDKDSTGTGKITLPLTTYFHNWVYTRQLATLAADTGLQVLRFDIPGNGPMNIDYIDFSYAGASGLRRAEAASLGSLRLSRAADGRIRARIAVRRAGPVSIRVYDASGSQRASQSLQAPGPGLIDSELAPSAPAPGMLFVEVRAAGQAVVRALAKP